jgi:hypothetical protein
MPIFKTVCDANVDVHLECISPVPWEGVSLFLTDTHAPLGMLLPKRHWFRCLWGGNIGPVCYHWKQWLFWRINRLRRKKLRFDRVMSEP